VTTLFFERHVFADPDLPIYFQFQIRRTYEPHFQFHWHETPEFIYITSGQVEIRINDKTELFHAGEMVVINPQSAHCFRAMDGDCSYFCLIPDNSLLSAGGISPGALSLANRIDDPMIQSHFKEIIREMEQCNSQYKVLVRSHIILMIALLIRHYTVDHRRSGRFDDNAMCIAKDAIQYMEEHYNEPIGGEEIASALGISRSYLCHVIRRVTNQTLTENLLFVRCRKAKEFLWLGHSVNETVYLSGFNNPSHFCRTYRKMMGVSPSSHKKIKTSQERKIV
jgi:AraC-like DNA-binding protein